MLKWSRVVGPFLVGSSLLAGCGDPCRDLEVPAGHSLEETAQAVLSQCLEKNEAPSGVVAIARGDEIAVAVKGKAQPDGTALTPEHLVRIGSVTKTFTAALVMRLAQQGALALDDHIGEYVSGVPNGEEITLEQLLRMTSGLANYTDLPNVQKDWSRPWSPDELLAEVRLAEASAAPGSKFAYSNTNYYLLGLAIERVTGKSYDDALQELVVEPAGLTNQVMLEGASRLEPSRLASGFTGDGELITQGTHPSVAFAAGALTATPEAVLSFVRRLEGDLLESGWRERLRSVGPVQGDGDPYAMGMYRQILEGRTVFGHLGVHPSGAAAWWMSQPDSDIRVFVQFGTHEVSARGAAESAMKVLLRK